MNNNCTETNKHICLWFRLALFVALHFAISTTHAQQGTSCSSAISLTVPFNLTNINSCNYGNNYAGTNGCLPVAGLNPYGGNDVYFSFVPASGGFITLQLYGVIGNGNVRPRMYLFQGCPNSGGVCVNALIGNTNPDGLSVILPVYEGITYYLIVDAAVNSSPNQATCFTFNLRSIFQPIPSVPGCTNMDFNTGDLSGWTGTLGRSVSSPAGSLTPNYLISSVGTLNNRQTITSAGTDPCGGFPQVDPLGGPYSLKLGNNSSGSQGEQLLQTFTVTEQNSSLTYRYAVVFQDPNHPSNQQPFFRAIVKDARGETVPCSDFIVSAAAGLPGFFTSSTCSSVRYKPWSTVNVDLSIFAGQDVTVEFTIGDCTQGGHYGYAYIDAFCSPSTLNALGDTICIGESVTMSAPDGYSSYRWLPMNSTAQSITVSPDTTTIYTLELTAFNGCVSTFNIPIVVTDYPVVSFTYEPDNCDFPVQFNETGNVNIGSLNSRWEFGAVATPGNSVSGNPLVQFPGQGTYPVKLVQTTAGGCVDSTIQDISVPACFFQFRMQGDTLCLGTCDTIEVDKYSGIPPYTYQWSTGSTDSTIIVCPSLSTEYSLTVTDAAGNVFTDSTEVTISPTITFQSEIGHISCYGEQDGSIETNPVGFGPFTALWSNDSTTLNLSGLGAGNYVLNLTDNFGCPSNELFTILEPDTIQAAVNLIEPTCNTNTGAIEIVNITGGTAPYLYGLEFGVYSDTGRIENLPIGNYTVVVQDTNGCRKNLSVQLQTTTAPQAIQLAVDYASCDSSNGTIQIEGVQGGISPYSYTFEQGSPEAIASFPVVLTGLTGRSYLISVSDSNNCFLDTLVTVFQPGAPETILVQISETSCGENNGEISINLIGGIAPISYSIDDTNYVLTNRFTQLPPGLYHTSIKDSNGCILRSEVEIDSSAGVAAQVGVISTIRCFNDTSGSVYAETSGGTAPFSFEWNTGVDNDSISSLPAGTYSVYILDDLGCTDTATTILSNPEPLVLEIPGEDSLCLGNSIDLRAVVTGAQGNITYDWLNGTFSQSQIQLTPDSSLIVFVSVNDSLGCRDSISQIITVLDNPTGVLRVDISEACGPVCVNYAVDVTGSETITDYLWSSGDSAVSTANFYKTCYEESGVYGVTLSLIDLYGCNTVLVDADLVTSYPLPEALFIVDPFETEIINPAIRLYQQSIGADSVFWSFGDGEVSEEFEPLHTYQDTGTFNICLQVFTENDCKDTLCNPIFIEAFPTFYAPNTFSPNNDGVNDVFKLYSTFLTKCRLEIYNRWGELLFFSESIDPSWDGTFNGNRLQNDTYVWRATFTTVFDKSQIVYGRVTLL